MRGIGQSEMDWSHSVQPISRTGSSMAGEQGYRRAGQQRTIDEGWMSETIISRLLATEKR